MLAVPAVLAVPVGVVAVDTVLVVVAVVVVAVVVADVGYHCHYRYCA